MHRPVRGLLLAFMACGVPACSEAPSTPRDSDAGPGDASVVAADCIPLLDHGSRDVARTVNVVFVAVNFASVEEAAAAARFELAEETQGALFHFEPFRSNQDAFTAWLVAEVVNMPDAGPHGSNFGPEAERLHPRCAVPNKQVITLSARHIGASATEGDVRIPHHPEWGTSSLAHEFGHAFGLLMDEYSYGNGAPAPPPEGFNCGVVGEPGGCGTWCTGPNRTAQELASVDCAAHLEATGSCNPQDAPCAVWAPADGGWFCINPVAACASQEDEASCLALESTRCAWLREGVEDGYWPTRCIPTSLDVDIGTGCLPGTGCFPGCSWSNWFRSSLNSTMNSSLEPFNVVSREILCDRIHEVTGTRQGSCAIP